MVRNLEMKTMNLKERQEREEEDNSSSKEIVHYWDAEKIKGFENPWNKKGSALDWKCPKTLKDNVIRWGEK